MSDSQGRAGGRPADPVGRLLHGLAFALMLAGGTLVSALSLMVVISVAGRWLLLAPIPGDFEIVAMGTAVGVFLFLPYCHMQRGNVLVDLFLARAPAWLQALCDVFSDLVLAAIAGLLAWRLWLGGVDMFRYNETSITLAIPTWWAFPFAVAGFGLLAICCLYTATRDLLTKMR